MRSDVRHYCRSCLTCASRKGTGIPVSRPFHRIGVDVLKLPRTTSGNQYIVVFVDYLMKLPEAFAIPDQRAETIAQLLCEQIICRHGIPEQLLSEGQTFRTNSQDLQGTRSDKVKHFWIPQNSTLLSLI